MRRRKYDHQQVYNFIVEHKSTHDGNSPSYKEIMEGLQISSTSVVDYILKHIEAQGLITLDANRSIQVVGGEWRMKCPGGISET